MRKIWGRINPGWKRILIVINFPILFVVVIGLLEYITKNDYFTAAIAIAGVVILMIKIPLLGVFYWIYDGFKKSKKQPL